MRVLGLTAMGNCSREEVCGWSTGRVGRVDVVGVRTSGIGRIISAGRETVFLCTLEAGTATLFAETVGGV